MKDPLQDFQQILLCNFSVPLAISHWHLSSAKCLQFTCVPATAETVNPGDPSTPLFPCLCSTSVGEICTSCYIQRSRTRTIAARFCWNRYFCWAVPRDLGGWYTELGQTSALHIPLAVLHHLRLQRMVLRKINRRNSWHILGEQFLSTGFLDRNSLGKLVCPHANCLCFWFHAPRYIEQKMELGMAAETEYVRLFCQSLCVHTVCCHIFCHCILQHCYCHPSFLLVH